MDWHAFWHNTFIQILVTIVIGIIAQEVAHRLIERFIRRAIQTDRYETRLDEKKREDTVVSIIRTATRVIISIITIIAILTIMKVHVTALLTGAGLFGVIFGLGAQNVIKDYMAGIYILTENQYRVGDIVTLSGGTTTQLGISGVVEDITLRITKLRDQDGTLSIVRNGDAGVITNRTFKYSAVVANIGVGYENDLDTVIAAINMVGKKMLEDAHLSSLILEPVAFLRVDSFTDAGVMMQCVGKVRPAAQWEVAGAFRKQLKQVFDAQSISFAMQQRVVHQATYKLPHTKAN
jgi:small-conductance mechanosensitive channel